MSAPLRQSLYVFALMTVAFTSWGAVTAFRPPYTLVSVLAAFVSGYNFTAAGFLMLILRQERHFENTMIDAMSTLLRRDYYEHQNRETASVHPAQGEDRALSGLHT